MKAAVGARLIPSNPTEGATIPKAVRKSLNVFNREQQGRFMEAIETEPLWKDFFYTECTTGLRKGEICGLRWEDFDENAGTLRIRHTLTEKGGGELELGDPKTERGARTILLPASTLHLLKKRKTEAVSEWVFPSLLDPAKPVSPTAAYECLKKILRRAGLPNLRFHDLRHGFSTNAIAAGVDPKSLAQILGHTKAECLEKLEKLTEECEGLNRKLPSRAAPSMPFGEWIDLWYQTWCKPGIRPTTQKSYETRIYQHIVPELGDIPP